MDVKIVAIVALAVLESIAMLTNTDGIFLLPFAAIIGGLAGYTAFSAKSITEGDKCQTNEEKKG